MLEREAFVQTPESGVEEEDCIRLRKRLASDVTNSRIQDENFLLSLTVLYTTLYSFVDLNVAIVDLQIQMLPPNSRVRRRNCLWLTRQLFPPAAHRNGILPQKWHHQRVSDKMASPESLKSQITYQ